MKILKCINCKEKSGVWELNWPKYSVNIGLCDECRKKFFTDASDDAFNFQGRNLIPVNVLTDMLSNI